MDTHLPPMTASAKLELEHFKTTYQLLYHYYWNENPDEWTERDEEAAARAFSSAQEGDALVAAAVMARAWNFIGAVDIRNGYKYPCCQNSKIPGLFFKHFDRILQDTDTTHWRTMSFPTLIDKILRELERNFDDLGEAEREDAEEQEDKALDALGKRLYRLFIGREPYEARKTPGLPRKLSSRLEPRVDFDKDSMFDVSSAFANNRATPEDIEILSRRIWRERPVQLSPGQQQFWQDYADLVGEVHGVDGVGENADFDFNCKGVTTMWKNAYAASLIENLDDPEARKRLISLARESWQRCAELRKAGVWDSSTMLKDGLFVTNTKVLWRFLEEVRRYFRPNERRQLWLQETKWAVPVDDPDLTGPTKGE